jgi:hypothetical protein
VTDADATARPPRAGREHRTHLSARWRLTLWYTALFVVAGAVLLALNYFLVDRSLHANPDEIRIAVAQRLGIPPSEVRTGEKGELPDADDQSVFRDVEHEIVHDHLEHLLTESALALAVMSAASLGLGWVIAGRVLRPVHRMTSTARKLSESNLHDRIALDGPHDELKELADTFDDMLGRLESAFDAQRRFVADASHELRTPLAIIRAEIDVTMADPEATPGELREMAETIREATARSEQLIDSLLVLARSDAASLATDVVDLSALADTACRRLADEAGARMLDVQTTLEPAEVVGDGSLLERLVANLVENAIRHNVDSGWITVETTSDATTASVRVANSGTRIEPSEVAALFDRFRRSEDARARRAPGFGLGLSIVAAVADAHHGTVDAEPLPEGGLAVTVALPARPRAGGERRSREASGAVARDVSHVAR